MKRPLSRWCLLPVLALGACSIPRTIDTIGDGSPPAELGRPGWVRTCASVGGWLGGVTGGVVSIVFLPVTYPLSLLADDSLREDASSEFLLFPATTMAAFGHSCLGVPADVVDWTFRRAWVGGEDAVTDYEWAPLVEVDVPQVPVDDGSAPR